MKYRREIDGLRAVAIIPVIFFHAGFNAFEGGFVGVDVFFVISGYLITTIILSDMNNQDFSIVTFYERRARRILPALFLVMLCCLPFAWMWLLPQHLKDFSQSLLAVSVFSSNILFWLESGYFGVASELKPLIHTWSLAVEEQFYVLFPLFLMVLWKLRKRWIFGSLMIVGVISLVAAQWGAYHYPLATFFLLHARGWELAIGALIAFYFLYKREHEEFIRSRKMTSEVFGFIGLLLICYSVVAFDENTPFPGLYALVPTVGAALIIVFSTSETIVGRILGTKPMVGIGLISYSTYLWHQPLFSFARHRSLTEPGASLFLVLSALSIILAYISWRYVETPFRNKKVVSRKGVFTFAVAGSLAFAATGIAGHFENGFPGTKRVPQMVEEISSYAELSKSLELSCDKSLTENSSLSGACKIGYKNNKNKFIIVGDSHARAITSSLNDIALNNGIGGLNYTFYSCPPLLLSKSQKYDEHQKSCNSLTKDLFDKAGTDEVPEYVILMSRWTIYFEIIRFNNNEGGIEFGEDAIERHNEFTKKSGLKDALAKDIVASVRKIISSGKKVVLVYPVPEAGWNVPDYLEKSYFFDTNITAMTASTSYSVFKNRNKFTYNVLDSIGEYDNLIRVFPEKLFCNIYVEERCVTHLDGKPLYYDDDHLSYLGAKLLSEKIMDATNDFNM